MDTFVVSWSSAAYKVFTLKLMGPIKLMHCIKATSEEKASSRDCWDAMLTQTVSVLGSRLAEMRRVLGG